MKKLVQIILILLIASCKLIESNDPNDTILDSTRFKELENPIEGKLYFVAGPNSTTEVDSFYHEMPWDFWKLEGSEFTKLNDALWPHNYVPYHWSANYSGRWNYQFSPSANYFSFFDDKGGPVWNTEDIGLLNMANFNEYFFTDSLGDANSSNGSYYQWSLNEEYIYFNSLKFGVSVEDSLADSDLFRVSPNNYLEQLSDTPFFESSASPSPNGKYLAFVIENRNNTPKELVGIHLLNLETLQTSMILNQNKYDSQNTHSWDISHKILWHPSSDYFVVHVWRYNKSTLTLFLDINSLEFEIIDTDNSLIPKIYFFIPNSNKLFQSQFNWAGEKNWSEYEIFDVKTKSRDYIPDNTNMSSMAGWGEPVVSPSGKYIAFVASDPNKWGLGNNDSDFSYQYAEIYIMDLSDYSITQLTNGLTGYEGYLRWTE